MGASGSVMSWPEVRQSELLHRLVSPESLCSQHPFWNGLLSFRMKVPKTKSDWRQFDADLEDLVKRLVANNHKSGNFGSLIDVFCTRKTELVHSVESDSAVFAWQSVNALFIIRICLKSFMERLDSEQQVLRQFHYQPRQPDPGEQQEAAQSAEDDSSRCCDHDRLTRLLHDLIDIVIDVPDHGQPYAFALRLEAVATLLVCLCVPLCQPHGSSCWLSSKVLRIVMASPRAATLTQVLLTLFSEQTQAPAMVLQQLGGGGTAGGSLVFGLASGVWNVLTLGYGSAQPAHSSSSSSSSSSSDQMMLCSSKPLADMSLLLLLALVNHSSRNSTQAQPDAVSNGHVEPDSDANHPYRQALFHCTGSKDVVPGTASANSFWLDFPRLFTALRSTLETDESSTLLLYLLLHRNPDFRSYLFASSDIDLIVVPILKTLYHAAERNNHHIYMSLIILLILTEDELFTGSVHDSMLKGMDWYTERILGDISLGGLLILVVIRTIQHNMLKMRDKYLHTNCLAALANMSSHFKNLHPYVCQRMVSMFEALAKKYFRLMKALQECGNVDQNGRCVIDMAQNSQMAMTDTLSDATVLEEVLRMILEILNCCLVAQIKTNANLIYTLLYKREVFEPLKEHRAFKDLSQNLHTVIHYFSSKLEQLQEKEGSLGVDQLQEWIQQSAMQFPRDKLAKFPDLKFRYVEEDQPEDFFIPYTWSLVRRKLYWNAKFVKWQLEGAFEAV